jgi:hypothetical protein
VAIVLGKKPDLAEQISRREIVSTVTQASPAATSSQSHCAGAPMISRGTSIDSIHGCQLSGNEELSLHRDQGPPNFGEQADFRVYFPSSLGFRG